MITVSALVNFFHMSSIVAWIGAILFISIILKSVFNITDNSIVHDMLEIIFRKFKILSIVCLILMVVSGILIAGREGATSVSIDKLYGVLFLIKHLLLIIMVASIFISKYYLFPNIKNLCKLNKNTQKLCKYQKKLLVVFYITSGMGFVVLLITAFMQLI